MTTKITVFDDHGMHNNNNNNNITKRRTRCVAVSALFDRTKKEKI